MKKELKRKYLPFNYRQDIYLKIQNFKQRDLSVEEYSAKFENLMIKGDLRETKEQSIASYVASMRFNIAIIIYMQPYSTLQDVIKLALKVETLNKYRSSTTTKSVAKEGIVEDSTSRNPNDAKTTHKPQVKVKYISCNKSQVLSQRDVISAKGSSILLLNVLTGKWWP